MLLLTDSCPAIGGCEEKNFFLNFRNSWGGARTVPSFGDFGKIVKNRNILPVTGQVTHEEIITCFENKTRYEKQL